MDADAKLKEAYARWREWCRHVQSALTPVSALVINPS